MKKHIITLSLMLLGATAIFSQDIIVRSTNDTIYGKILKVDDENIQYQTNKGNITTTHTIARKYVSSFETNVQEQSIENKTIKNSSFRLAFAGGIAFRGGKNDKSGDRELDRMSSDLGTGFGLEAELQYFFNENYGIALDLNYAKYSTAGRNVTVYGSHFSQCNVSQNILFLGPAFAVRYDTGNWLLTANVGLGVLLYSENLSGTHAATLTSTAFGFISGIGAEYKFNKQFSGGLKLSSVAGNTRSLYSNGTKFSFDNETLSLSSTMILGCISFTIK